MPELTYIKLFVDYLYAIEPLGDAERGRLFTSLLEYARSGEAEHLSGNERFIFPMMRAQIDRDAAAMREISEARSEAGKKGAEAKQANVGKCKQMQAKPSKSSKEKEEDKDKDKDNISPPLSPSPGETGFGNNLQSAFDSWIAYKAEKRQGYKPTGLKNLVSEVRNNAAKYGEDAVADLIRECMANNWQGIIFDRLRKREEKPGKQYDPMQKYIDDFKKYGMGKR